MNLKTIDINCDLGEGKTLEDCALDAQLMPFISRCNIACAGHAGNELTMRKTLENAKLNNVLCGAHPGYPDLANFGRISLDIKLDDLIIDLLSQIERLETIAKSIEQPLRHVKLHGALYNDAERSSTMSEALCQALAKTYPHLSLIGLTGGAMQIAASNQQITFLREGFMDRAYLSSGHLAPRALKGSVYQQTQTCIDQVMAMLTHQPIDILPIPDTKPQHKPLIIDVDTYCLHGDSSIAQELAVKLHLRLQQNGYKVA